MRTRSNKTISAILASLFLLACQPVAEEKKFLLPIIGEKHLSNTDTIYHSVGNFTLTNQYGEPVSEQTVKNKIYVADFFFATCQSICPQMSKNMVDVQKAFEKDDDILILSHTVNPLHDTVDVLNKYGIAYNAKKGKWHFLTGDKKIIYALAMKDYLVNALEDDGTEEGFIHSEFFLLIDKQTRIRGVYDGTDKVQVNKLIADIKLLKTEK
ncbi:MAG: SCO family protein [Bacteroidota bacterium]|nr:SCO family protein [Bacteroidota bacterium]